MVFGEHGIIFALGPKDQMERLRSWSNAPAWRAGIPQGIVGSNPTLSA